jgi:cyclopropane-fatty-acyl-phospholipid synthase
VESAEPLTIRGRVLNAAEHGRLPDAAVRFGIRRLLKERLRDVRASDTEAWLSQFVSQTLDKPIAVVPEKANEQHYEVPSEFFQIVLGRHLKYSSCLWSDGVASLDDAEAAALHETCDHAQLENGQQVLELGCGWGSLSLWMAERFPQSWITAVSNSGSQREFILARAAERGLSNLQVMTANVAELNFERRFDRVVSVEMFEHMRNHTELMRRIHGWLNPGGKLFVHIFCHRSVPYLFEADGESNWMGRHFFSGGMMPAEDYLVRCRGDFLPVNQWTWNGRHYARTCRAWLQRLDENRSRVVDVFRRTCPEHDPKLLMNRWRLFFMACEELFAWDRGREWVVQHSLFGSRTES